ncbi:piezo-type mechanosensitive ion channel component-like [Ctenocephalides felis]|uniref:piezo-type mechanosensitive ion channel component-like n=1 Tax=Ctenocephalides felis TaxID=7515 RepID=UPI000E6E1F5C|nr:piezo-type mechanosensitive ion channel component-like [Ctenocephalides felis]
MDWIWTDTSMSMFDWLKMEDIFSTIFQLKCARNFEEQFPVARGMKKKWAVKLLMGGGAVLLIVMIMWFPLVFFAIGNTVGSPNIPYEVTAELRIGSMEPVFKGVATREDITQFNERQWQQLSNAYRRDRTAQTFLSNYEYRDASAVTFRSNSLTTWRVAPPDVKHLVHEINSNRTVRVTLRYSIRHSVNSPNHPLIIEVEKFVLLMDPVQRQNLAALLSGNGTKL